MQDKLSAIAGINKVGCSERTADSSVAASAELVIQGWK